MKALASALSVAAIVRLVAALTGLANTLYRRSVFKQLLDGDGGEEAVAAVVEKLATLHSLTSTWFIALNAVIVGAMVVAATKLPVARRMRGRVAAGLFGLGVAMGLAFFLFHLVGLGEGKPTTLERIVWIVHDTVFFGGLALFLHAAVGAIPKPGSFHVGVGIYAVFAIVLTGFSGFYSFAETREEMAYFVLRGLLLFGDCVFFGVALAASNKLRTLPADGMGPAKHGEGAFAGGPLRMLAQLIGWRIGLGLLLAVAMRAAVANKAFDAASAVVLLGVLVALGLGAATVACALGYLKLPEEARDSGALGAFMAFIGLSFMLDVWSATIAVDLFGTLDEGLNANSFWGMPSVSKLEAQQASLQWTARFGQLAGIGAILGLLQSLKQTARWSGRGELVERASSLMGLVVLVGLGALALGAVLESGAIRGKSLLPFAIGGGLLTLVVAVWMLVGFVGLLGQTADAVELVDAQDDRGEDDEDDPYADELFER